MYDWQKMIAVLGAKPSVSNLSRQWMIEKD